MYLTAKQIYKYLVRKGYRNPVIINHYKKEEFKITHLELKKLKEKIDENSKLPEPQMAFADITLGNFLIKKRVNKELKRFRMNSVKFIQDKE